MRAGSLIAAAVVAGNAAIASHRPALAQKPPVETARVEEAPIIHRVRLSGTVVSSRTAGVSTDIGGLVQDVKVERGDWVSEGTVLVQLDEGLEKLELKRAESATAAAREELKDALRRLTIGRRLAKSNNLPQNELDAREAQVRIVRAQVDRLEAEEAHVRERLRRHAIEAPFTGVVSRRMAQEGEWISPGTAVVELVDMERLYVDVPVPQRYFVSVNDDPVITLRLDALPERRIDAQVAARVPVSDPTARTFVMRLHPAARDVPLTPGMSAQVTFRLKTGERGLVVPRDAIIRYPDGRTTVWITRSGDNGTTVTERQVSLGHAFDGRVHVTRGLEADERVVVRGNEALRPDQAVRLVDQGS